MQARTPQATDSRRRPCSKMNDQGGRNEDHCETCVGRRARAGRRVRRRRGRAGAGLSEPGHPADLRLSGRQRRRRLRALFRREAAADRGPHRDRREQGRAPRATSRPSTSRARSPTATCSIRSPAPRSRRACICSRTRRSMSARRCRSRPPPAISPSCSWSTPRARYKTVAELTAAMKKKGDKASYAVAANPGRIMGAIYKQHGRARGGRGAVPHRAGFPERVGAAAGSTTACTIRSSRSRRRAKGGCASSRSATGAAAAVAAGHPDHDASPAFRWTSSLWWGVMVPAATPKPIVDKINQWFGQIVAHRGDQEVPRRCRRRSDDQHAGTGAAKCSRPPSRNGANTSGWRRSSRCSGAFACANSRQTRQSASTLHFGNVPGGRNVC